MQQPQPQFWQPMQQAEQYLPQVHQPQYVQPRQQAIQHVPLQSQPQCAKPQQQEEQDLQQQYDQCLPLDLKQELHGHHHHLSDDAFAGFDAKCCIVRRPKNSITNAHRYEERYIRRVQLYGTPTDITKKQDTKVERQIGGYNNIVMQQQQQQPVVLQPVTMQLNHQVMYADYNLPSVPASGVLSGQGWFKHVAKDDNQEDATRRNDIAMLQQQQQPPVTAPVFNQIGTSTMQTNGVLSGQGWFKHLG
jgi:hypothetical protein